MSSVPVSFREGFRVRDIHAAGLTRRWQTNRWATVGRRELAALIAACENKNPRDRRDLFLSNGQDSCCLGRGSVIARMHGRWCSLLVLSLLTIKPCATYAAEPETNLVGIYQGSALSQKAAGLEYGGYELSDGTWQSFRRWYHTDWTDLRFEMLTQYSENFGIIWGASTGESAEKFRIDPGVKLGLMFQEYPTPATTLSLSLSTVLAGNLKEFPCVADYGDIGGIQTVNCRLAASPLPPAETLRYLIKDTPARMAVRLTFSGNF